MNANQPAAPARQRASVRYLQRLAGLLVCLIPFHGFGAPGEKPAPDNIETRMLACTPCHGVRGQGTQDDYVPRLASKPAGYLYQQLGLFATVTSLFADELPAGIPERCLP